MTALNDFDRLESTGIWQASPDAQRRDVIISVGEATLTLANQQNSALTHWSLPAIRRVNPDEMPALFSPGSASQERLELTDETMIEAISKVQVAIEKRKPHPGRLRFALTGGASALVLGLAIFWLPGAMLKYTASVVPAQKRAAIGQSLLDNIQRIAGKPCDNPLGVQSLNQLHRRLFGSDDGKIVVVSSGVNKTIMLPGKILVINRALLEDHEEPDVVAGYLLAENLRSRNSDPFANLLRRSGLKASFGLLTTGKISEETLMEYAEVLLVQKTEPVADLALLKSFELANIQSTPYAYALDISGETSIKLIEADPVSSNSAKEILDDGSWVSLQGICDS